jgi:hypothetical protein
MDLPFEDWKRKLFDSAGSTRATVMRLGDYVLELFWRDGCEPSISALLDYAQSGLQPRYEASSKPSPRLAATRP